MMDRIPEIGAVLDDTYRLVELLGKGAFGAVYRARQLNMDRDVAVKLLLAGGPHFEHKVQRFRREVMAIRNLQHPNTVRIYDFREGSDGLWYYTMEALEGHNLREEVRRNGPMAPRRVVRIVRQVLKSLAEAHAQGILHRDLKPANVMLVQMHGETDFVKVLDFGIAKVLEGRGDQPEDVEDLTSTGMLIGTPRYMAPEQIVGEELGPHTDLYAVGLLAMNMLTGARVFADTDRRTLIQRQLSDEPVPVSETVAESALGPALRKCLHKDCSRRFASAEQLLEALDDLEPGRLEDQPLYVADGQGGFSPRASVPNPAETDDVADAKTELLDVQPLREAGDSPVESDQQSRSDRAEGESPSARAPAASSADGAAVEPPPDTSAVSSSGGGSAGKIAVTAVIIAVAGAVAVAFWQNLGEDEEPRQDDQPAVTAEGPAQAPDNEGQLAAEEQSDDSSDEPQPSASEHDQPEGEAVTHITEIDVANEGITAEVYVGDESRGTTPRVLEWDEGELEVRLEADDYEPEYVRLDDDVGDEFAVELQHRQNGEVAAASEAESSPEQQEDVVPGGHQRGGDPPAVAGVDAADDGSETEPRDEPQPEADPQETQPDGADGDDEDDAGSEEDEPVEDPADEPAEDDGWVDVTGQGDEGEDEGAGEGAGEGEGEGEGEGDVPLF